MTTTSADSDDASSTLSSSLTPGTPEDPEHTDTVYLVQITSSSVMSGHRHHPLESSTSTPNGDDQPVEQKLKPSTTPIASPNKTPVVDVVDAPPVVLRHQSRFVEHLFELELGTHSIVFEHFAGSVHPKNTLPPPQPAPALLPDAITSPTIPIDTLRLQQQHQHPTSSQHRDSFSVPRIEPFSSSSHSNANTNGTTYPERSGAAHAQSAHHPEELDADITAALAAAPVPSLDDSREARAVIEREKNPTVTGSGEDDTVRVAGADIGPDTPLPPSPPVLPVQVQYQPETITPGHAYTHARPISVTAAAVAVPRPASPSPSYVNVFDLLSPHPRLQSPSSRPGSPLASSSSAASTFASASASTSPASGSRHRRSTLPVSSSSASSMASNPSIPTLLHSSTLVYNEVAPKSTSVKRRLSLSFRLPSFRIAGARRPTTMFNPPTALFDRPISPFTSSEYDYTTPINTDVAPPPLSASSTSARSRSRASMSDPRLERQSPRNQHRPISLNRLSGIGIGGITIPESVVAPLPPLSPTSLSPSPLTSSPSAPISTNSKRPSYFSRSSGLSAAPQTASPTTSGSTTPTGTGTSTSISSHAKTPKPKPKRPQNTRKLSKPSDAQVIREYEAKKAMAVAAALAATGRQRSFVSGLFAHAE